MLTSPKGPIEKLVKAGMPLSRLGRMFLVSISPIIHTIYPGQDVLITSLCSVRSDLTVPNLTTSNSCATKMQTFPGLSVFYSSSQYVSSSYYHWLYFPALIPIVVLEWFWCWLCAS